MENRVCNVIRAFIEDTRNPVISIHDQGAGGTANVTKEIIYPIGGIVDIRNITTGDPTLTTVEKWIAEYQEQITILIKPQDLHRVQQIATRENIDAVVFGYTSMDGIIRVRDDSGEPVCLDLTKIFKPPKKTYTDRHSVRICVPTKLPNVDFEQALYDVFRLESVGSKRFLTNKVDRSVTGLIVQQQCVGPLSTPISDYALVAHSYFCSTGTATSIGEQPLKAFDDPRKSGQLAVIEMLTNLMWVKISNLKDIKCSVNWMWPAKLPGENAAMYDCMQSLSTYMINLGISADGGKDSVSMYTRQNESTIIKSPRSVVVSAYVTVPNIHTRVTTELKGNSVLLHIPTDTRQSLGGSALFQAFECEGGEIYIPTAGYLKKIFMCIQRFITTKLITAGHDISDGGLITCILEMAIAGDIGLIIESINLEALSYYFSETPGVVIEVPREKIVAVERDLLKSDVSYTRLGETTTNKKVLIRHNERCLINYQIGEIRGWWEQTSREYETVQTSALHATAEWEFLTEKSYPRWTSRVHQTAKISGKPPRVAVLRDEGSNGSREMSAAFSSAGFEVWDITMTDLLTEPRLLDQFRGLAFVGGFTYADVFGAGTGWAAQIKHHIGLSQSFTRFRERKDTFSFGVCNGCQLMSQLGWVPSCKFKKNLSKRFESRISTVSVTENNSIMLKNLDLTTFGIWVAHTEGRFVGEVPKECIAMQYVDHTNTPTEEYPLNPSGSDNGICGICSPDGRHLAMMPHPERCWLTWQMPWVPTWWEEKYTPWFGLFVNAYQWCK
uniref:CobB/CobQ-like glutamine amidotransferase domain protein n=1 Tax=Marseillevirus LCMAC201 TaxID=2506605 RepID=A0A481YWR9_9VIRU|nr:MAG: CobB/CobQ-like glutamine amidotransferase domain protein [Marseillevirus LCMAC201]